MTQRTRTGRGRRLPWLFLLLLAATMISTGTASAQINGDAGEPFDELDTLEGMMDTLPPPRPRDFDLMSLGAEIVTSPGAGTFFDGYKPLGGTVNSLDARISPSLMLRLSTAGPIRITIYSAYNRASFIDIYGVVDSSAPSAPTRGTAALVEEFDATAIPVLVGVEYAPVRTQFTTYVGAGVGAAYNFVDWNTIIRSQTIGDYYRPGANVSNSGVSLAARVYAGADFRFDKNYWGEGPIRGIYLEGSYLLLPVSRDYFAAIRERGRGIQNLPDHDSGVLDLGGLAFTIGLNLQFVRH